MSDKNQTTDYIEYRCPPHCNGLICRYKENNDAPWAFEIKCHRHNCSVINYRGNVIMSEPVDFRCMAIDAKRSAKWGKEVVCNKLLARIVPGTILEIKCSRCRSIETSKHIIYEDKDNE